VRPRRTRPGPRGGIFRGRRRGAQTLGGFGYAKEFDVERLWREVRLYKIAPVSQQMALNYLAERVLGLPKSY
jgi:alkylation response protein AidB-like acyl-CoA dehydrogenase